MKASSDGDKTAKSYLHIFARSLGVKVLKGKQIVTRRSKELSHDVSQQLKDLVQTCTFL